MNSNKKENKRISVGGIILIVLLSLIVLFIIFYNIGWPLIQKSIITSTCKTRYGSGFKAGKCKYNGWKCINSKGEIETLEESICIDDYSGINAKPIIYIYPEEDMDLTIKLGNKDLLNYVYPEYNDGWNIHVDKTGKIYDYNTKRNYYSLFWDAKDNSIIDLNEGFVVNKKDTTKFLEDKLEYLGLNYKEIEEFIIYWLPILNKNEYNYIRFRTIEEINNYMPLNISVKPDTLIRVSMDFKGLDKKIKVKEQKLQKATRSGFTIVEWGGRDLNN